MCERLIGADPLIVRKSCAATLESRNSGAAIDNKLALPRIVSDAKYRLKGCVHVLQFNGMLTVSRTYLFPLQPAPESSCSAIVHNFHRRSSSKVV